MTFAEKFTYYVFLAGAAVLGGGSLVLFAAFLYVGSLEFIPLGLATGPALALDALLCLAFFIQHSGMIRKPFQQRLAVLPPAMQPAFYAIASGIVLLLLLAFWQRSDIVVYSVEGPARGLLRAGFLAAIAGLLWGIHALKTLDALGLRAILSHLRGKEPRRLPLAARGPYRWVRHPLYFGMLVLIWTCPDVSLDRLLFAILWTAWIVLGTILEERDLLAEYGADYRAYQRSVPMLIPWRIPRRLDADDKS